MNIFSIENVTKTYSGHTALNNVSIDIPESKVFGLLGPNGAGKTTLIRIINQITAPDSGTVLFKGQPLKATDVERIGYLPEERGLYKKMKVGEQAIYLAQLKGLTKSDATKRLKYWFNKFEIMPWWHRKVEELSKGMQQKVQFIVTILHEPELLIFDEPFSGFDPINANMLKNEILELKNKGATVIFSTHNMTSVEEVCDNIALINNSEKILEGSVTDVRNRYKGHIYECKYTGSFQYVLESLSGFEIVEHSEHEANNYIKVSLPESINSNSLIEKIIKNGELISFNEFVPNMNEIFIKAVTGENK